MKHLYDYGVEQKIAKEENKQNNRLRVGLMTSVLICLLIFIIAMYQWNAKIKRKQETVALRNKHLELQNELFASKEELHVLQMQKGSLERALTEANANTESIIQELIEDNRKKLQEQYSYIEVQQRTFKEWKDGMQRVQATEGENAIQEVNDSYMKAINQLNHALTLPGSKGIPEELWKVFTSESIKRYPITTSLLDKVRNLNSEEYRVALLVLAEFRPRTIEDMLDKKSGYATKIRKRLLKKIFGKYGKANDFDAQLSSFKHNYDVRQFFGSSERM